LKDFFYKAESSYGTIPSNALVWAGTMRSITPSPLTDRSPEFITLPGSRGYGEAIPGTFKYGFNVKCLSRRTAHDWTVFWAAFGLGAANGVAAELPSFLAQIALVNGAVTSYNFFNGCKVNKLSISGDKVGEKLIFEADVMAQWCTVGTSKTITGIQSVTVGADPSAVTTGVLTWDSAITYNLGGAGAVAWSPSKWKLSVDNHLVPQMGNRTGADAAQYVCPVAMHEGGRDIILEVTQPRLDEAFQNAKLAGTAMTAVTIVIGTKTITLSNGDFEANDLATADQENSLEETVKIRFKGLSIA
jgi:hypothetical protein